MLSASKGRDLFSADTTLTALTHMSGCATVIRASICVSTCSNFVSCSSDQHIVPALGYFVCPSDVSNNVIKH